MTDTYQTEFFIVGIVLLIAAAPVAWHLMRERHLVARIGMIVVWVAVYIGASSLYFRSIDKPVPETEVTGRPIREQRNGYVGSETCHSCHADTHKSWRDSYHSKMTQLPDAESVIAPFQDTVLTLGDKSYHLENQDNDFWINIHPSNTESPVVPSRHKVVMTTGSHHMQVYWYGADEGRDSGILPFVYLIDEQRWIPRHYSFIRSPDLPTEEPDGRWNINCIKCHSTNGIHGELAADGDSPLTSVAEFGISCEACHGPGEEHVAVNRNPARRYQLHLAGSGDPTLVQPGKLDKEPSSQVCGQCHSSFLDHSFASFEEWKKNGFKYRPGDDLKDSRFIVRRGQAKRPAAVQKTIEDDPMFLDGYFWRDGMVRVSGREYNGLVESPCYKDGQLTCLSCHTLHQKPDDPRPAKVWADDQLGVGMRTNKACTQCHTTYDDPQTLAAHTFHDLSSSGSQCYNCHMPHTTYGLLKGIHSHTIDSPSIIRNLAVGRPNACNLCHLDQTLEWTAGHLAQRYGHPVPEIPDTHRQNAASIVWLLGGDAALRGIIAWHLSWEEAQQASGTHWMTPHLSAILSDPYEAVRVIAQRSLPTLPGVSQQALADFDPRDDFPARLKTANQLIDHWETWAAGQEIDWQPHHLISPAGSLDRARFIELSRQRDDTRLLLNE